MVRSKRLRNCEITTLQDDQAQSNGDDLSPTLDPTSENQPILESEPSENNLQVQESTNVEDNDTLEIIDEQGNSKKKRGVTRAKDVWNLPSGERIKVEWNNFGQPIKKGGGILGGWLGTVARRGSMCPIHYQSWKDMPTAPFKLNIIRMTRTKFLLPRDDRVEAWVLKSVSRKWKDYKHELKAKYKKPESTPAALASNVPPEIVSQQWIDLVRNWFSERSEVVNFVQLDDTFCSSKVTSSNARDAKETRIGNEETRIGNE